MVAMRADASNHLDKVTSQLSAHIWGHRFKEGQRGAEYVLEFLNVLYGTDYSFIKDSYVRKRSIGLRKFIFEGVKEGAGSRGGILILTDEEKIKLQQAVRENDLPVLKQFLRNLEIVLYDLNGKEADRSWYARSLYPLHESLLYFELRKVGDNLAIERNFFARGGELYFLMLAHGTEKHPERREFIESRFRQLLTKNKIIENVVTKITSAIDEDKEEYKEAKLRSDKLDDCPILPVNAPVENEHLFENFAIELEQLLQVDLDVYEVFHLLMTLICFQLNRYMYERAHLPNSENKIYYFFDCMESKNKNITYLSARIFEQHELIIKEKLDQAFENKYKDTVGSDENIEQLLPSWREKPEQFLELMGLQKLKSRKKTIVQKLMQCHTPADVKGKLKDVVREVASESLTKEMLSIIRTLARDGGFATFRRGSAANYRYTISDTFLQMLVFTKVKPQGKMEFFEFLDVLYRDYGIVIGEKQAKDSGLYDMSRLNVRYFQENEKALRDKLLQNGLLIEFSDATAMIENPYAASLVEA